MKASQITPKEQELEIIKRLADGKRNKQIADELYLSHRTIENKMLHLRDKYGDFGGCTPAGLVALFLRQKWII